MAMGAGATLLLFVIQTFCSATVIHGSESADASGRADHRLVGALSIEEQPPGQRQQQQQGENDAAVTVAEDSSPPPPLPPAAAAVADTKRAVAGGVALGSGKCLQVIRGYWTYEVCLGVEVVQFHSVVQGVDRKQVTSLGKYVGPSGPAAVPVEASDEMDEAEREDQKAEAAAAAAAAVGAASEQEYADGDLCPRSSKRRDALVRLTCGAADKLVDAREPAPCHYELAVQLRAACPQQSGAGNEEPTPAAAAGEGGGRADDANADADAEAAASALAQRQRAAVESSFDDDTVNEAAIAARAAAAA